MHRKQIGACPCICFGTGEAAQLRIVSLDGRGTDRAPSFEMPLAELLPNGQPLPLVEARAIFADDTARRQAGTRDDTNGQHDNK